MGFDDYEGGECTILKTEKSSSPMYIEDERRAQKMDATRRKTGGGN